ncbi:Secondary metabolism regulator laeA [Paramyrothecium foliicola]|nr:Secondary metabolism regulator laeA [Paramyrothecium foliicola]
MAKKRRIKQQNGARQRSSNCRLGAMSSDDCNAIQSDRQSSDGTMSEQATASDGAQTTMTSIMDTDEDLLDSSSLEGATGADEADPDQEEEHGVDTQSLYPTSHYPRVPSPHRTERPYGAAESSGFAVDIEGAASTRSLWAQDLDYRDIHGRRYCKDYYMPNDEIEQLRLSLLHQVFYHVLDGEPTLAPLDNPSHILDVGTGTGEWAIRVAELFPDCDVVGTDISAIAETQSVPMNVFFEIEDAEDWDRLPEFYDLIHFRMLEGAFRDWSFIYDNAFYSLKPGGWIEVQDFDAGDYVRKFLGQFPPESPVHGLSRDLGIAAKKSGRPLGCAHLDPREFLDAGFVDVSVREFVIPLTINEKTAAKLWLISCLDMFEARYMRLLTEQMGYDGEKCKAACERAARELTQIAKDMEKSKTMQVKMRIVVARKPLDAKPFAVLAQEAEAELADHDTQDALLPAAAEDTLISAEPA